MRKILSILFLVLLMASIVGCGGDTGVVAEYNTYDKYGFVFQYHKSFRIIETGSLTGEANDIQGEVWAQYEKEGESALEAVVWIALLPDLWYELEEEQQREYLEAMMDVYVLGMTMSGEDDEATVELGEMFETIKLGHILFYQPYRISMQGFDDVIYSTGGVMYCDKIQKMFNLATMYEKDQSYDDATATFTSFLGRFICHDGEGNDIISIE